MQSLPTESTPPLPFTYCLFLDDHFPCERESPLSLSLHVHSASFPSKSPGKSADARTQASFIAPEAEDTFSLSPNDSPARGGFLSAQDSDSDLDAVDIMMSSCDEAPIGKGADFLPLCVSGELCTFESTSVHFSSYLETASLEPLELEKAHMKTERKSGFSIWSVISPDLGIGNHETDQSRGRTRSAKVTAAKLKMALRGSHFQRVERGLRKLLGRDGS